MEGEIAVEEWWYVRNDRRLGPFIFEHLKEIFQRGEIGPMTMVWRQGMAEWSPIHEVPALGSIFTSTSPPISGINSITSPAISDINSIIPPPLPSKFREEKLLDLPLATRWPRYFARLFDLWWEVVIVSLIVGHTLGRYSTSFVEWINTPGSTMIFNILIVPLALLLDAVVQAVFGNTPGKALLGLRVTTIRGERLSLRQQIDRNMDVWVLGLGLGIPFVALFTMAKQAGRLKTLKCTSYDEKLLTRVYAKPLGLIRSTAFGVLFCAMFVGMVTLKGMEQDHEAEIKSRNIEKLYFWENPITKLNVPIEAKWKHSVATNLEGQKIFTFSELGDRAAVVFAVEVADRWSLDQYVRSLQKGVASEMKFSNGGIFEDFNGFSSWRSSAVMVNEVDNRVTVRVVQIENKFWRIVKVQALPYSYSNEMLQKLENDLWKSVLKKREPPQT